MCDVTNSYMFLSHFLVALVAREWKGHMAMEKYFRFRCRQLFALFQAIPLVTIAAKVIAAAYETLRDPERRSSEVFDKTGS